MYSFQDLLELRIIERLLASGVGLPAVRRATRYLRRNLDAASRPLARVLLLAGGRQVVARIADETQLIDATAGGQVVLAFAVAPLAEAVRAKVTELRATRELRVRVGGRDYLAVLTPDLEVGGFSIEVPELRGLITEADSLAEARRMVKDAILVWHGEGASRRLRVAQG